MDIEYLLLLQKFRELINDFLTPFMELLSLFSISFVVFLPAFIYWVIDKKKGLFVFLSYYLCCSFNALVKLTACVYRPWIKDPRVIPYGDSLSTATGYSFPSGHVAISGPIYGGTAIVAKDKKKYISVICIILLLLTGFSRNYLGVHTPQDVLVALLETALALFAAAKLIAYVEKHPEKENVLLAASFLIGVIGIFYITFKPYPMDYVDGKLLVDPLKMMTDGYGDICLLIAFLIARFVERKWVRFEPAGLKNGGWLMGLIGLLPLGAMMLFLKNWLDALLGAHWGHFTYSIIAVLYCIALYPALINLYHRIKNKKNAEEKPEEYSDAE